MITHNVPKVASNYAALTWGSEGIELLNFVRLRHATGPTIIGSSMINMTFRLVTMRPDGYKSTVTNQIDSSDAPLNRLFLSESCGDLFVTAYPQYHSTAYPNYSLSMTEEVYNQHHEFKISRLEAGTFTVARLNQTPKTFKVGKPIYGIALSPDQNMVAVLTRGKLFIFDLGGE